MNQLNKEYQFVHLNLHSEYSLVDGVVRIPELMKKLVELKMPAIALTDYMNLFGAIKFYRHALKHGIKPIIGAEINIYFNSIAKNTRMILLCQNQNGYQNLIKLLTYAYQQQNDHIKEQQLAEHSTGLIALLSATEGVIGQLLLQDEEIKAQQQIKWLNQYFPERYYFEITRIGKAQEEQANHRVLTFAKQHNIPVAATNAIRFLSSEDYEAHEIRVCINRSEILVNPKRTSEYTEMQYLRSATEMNAIFADLPTALQNTFEIAKRCSVHIELGKVFLPSFPTPNKQTEETYIRELAEQALKEFLQNQLIKADETLYRERLKLELDVICRMGYGGYFLVVADFINWAKSQHIPVGPGRGSGAGSLVAYLLKITNIDPLAYDLLFERFLNPERVSMPDFDVDFCMEGRDRVIEYVINRYGSERVSQIITFGTMAAKAVVRDVGRVLGLPYGFVDSIAKMIPFEIGITLEKALSQEENLRKRYDTDDTVRNLLDLALKLEGIVRNASKHAGGVVIAPSPLTDFVPLYSDRTDELVTQFDKDDVEAVGLIKFDFLGLRTLTIIDWAVAHINRVRQQQNKPPLNIDNIPLDDEKTFELLKSCHTTGVFQLESRGFKELIKRLKPDCLEDIIALVALYRPGPLQSGMVDDFIARKHGQAKIEYLHPELEPILRATYGVILYQEQVMQIAQVLAGYTLGSADLLRRAMGKKKPEEMAKQRSVFIAGAGARNIHPDLANQIFDLMEKFAGYGFNKSHSAAYALIAYQTAWLKAHYPAAFMAAVLSADMDRTEKVVNFIKETQRMGLTVEKPDINKSNLYFEPLDAQKINFGLGAIKGVGKTIIEEMLAARNSAGAFQDLFDFCQRVHANKKILEAFIYSGCFDCFGQTRKGLLTAFDVALKVAEQSHALAASGQIDIFATEQHDMPNLQYAYIQQELPDKELLENEKATLGFYLTHHPLNFHAVELSQFVLASLNQIYDYVDQSILVAGLVATVKTFITKRGDKMAFITLEDQSERAEVVVFSDCFKQCEPLLVKDQIVILEVDVQKDNVTQDFRLIAKNVYSLTDARMRFAKMLVICIDAKRIGANSEQKLKNYLLPFSNGKCPVTIRYINEQASVDVLLDSQWNVNLHEELLENICSWLDKNNVQIVY